jgi:hypothetical protein
MLTYADARENTALEQELARIKALHQVQQAQQAQVLNLLALLVQKYKYRQHLAPGATGTGTKFPCFTGTKVQIPATPCNRRNRRRYSIYLLYWYKSTNTGNTCSCGPQRAQQQAHPPGNGPHASAYVSIRQHTSA